MTDTFRTHLQHLVGERHLLTAPKALHYTERYLVSQFTHWGWQVTTQPFTWRGHTCENIIAEYIPSWSESSTPALKEEHRFPLIIGAHYDTVRGSPGADDNASGLAVLLEVARCLPSLSPRQPVRLIAFDMEEEDLTGSLFYAKELRDRNRQIRGAIILECVGYAGEDHVQQVPAGLPISLPSAGDFLGLVGNQDSGQLLAAFEQASRDTVPDLKTISLAVPGQGEMFPDTRRSDHAAFWHFGFPAMMVTDTANFRNPNYHRPSDTLDTLNLEFLNLVAQAVIATIIVLDHST